MGCCMISSQYTEGWRDDELHMHATGCSLPHIPPAALLLLYIVADFVMSVFEHFSERKTDKDILRQAQQSLKDQSPATQKIAGR